MTTLIDLTGQRFNRWTVLKLSPLRTSNRGAKWECLCDCGMTRVVAADTLKSGTSKSCGCHKKESLSARTKKHGECRKTRVYKIWEGMKARCSNENRKEYPNYGGRGITVCEEWSNSFEAFCNWALSHGYSDDLTIERKDNDKGYFPDNCKWATRKEQQNNTRNNVAYKAKLHKELVCYESI